MSLNDEIEKTVRELVEAQQKLVQLVPSEVTRLNGVISEMQANYPKAVEEAYKLGATDSLEHVREHGVEGLYNADVNTMFNVSELKKLIDES